MAYLSLVGVIDISHCYRLAAFHGYSLTPVENNLGRARKKITVGKLAFLEERDRPRARTFDHTLLDLNEA